MKAAIRRLSFNGEFFEDNAVRDGNGALVKTGHTTETCQYYAFYFGTASKEDYPALAETLVSRFGPKRDPERDYPAVYPSNAFIGNYLRLELLLRWGFKERVLDECRDFFLGMAEMTGTLWEHSRLTGSLNHGFASMAAVYISECVK
jgi:alpha-L-rhamnosidase